MDNVTHTLVGVALSRAFFKNRMPLATIGLVAAANAPDLDILAGWRGIRSIEFHRNITHSFLFLPVWAAAIAALIFLASRRLRKAGPPFRWWMAVVAGAVGVGSHLLLDWTNSYGIRLLAPLNQRWYALDWEYIVDPWVWLMFGMLLLAPMILGLISDEVGARKNPHRFSAGLSLLLLCGWMGLRYYEHAAAVDFIQSADVAEQYGNKIPDAIGMFPTLASPFSWHGVLDLNTSYLTASVNTNTRKVDFEREFVKPPQEPPLLRAENSHDGQIFLNFARFPLADVATLENGYRVSIADLRFSEGNRRPNVYMEFILDANLNTLRENLVWASDNPSR